MGKEDSSIKVKMGKLGIDCQMKERLMLVSNSNLKLGESHRFIRPGSN